jgi:6-phosphogluconolactonase
MNNNSINWQFFKNAEAVAYETYQRILTLSKQTIDKKGSFKIVLAGGNTPKQTYQLLKAADTHWSHWHVYYGDERCLPENDRERNSLMAAQVWLDHLAIPATQIHPIPAHLGPIEAARCYTDIVNKALPFDMVLLGMGEDGHTASLFPGHRHAQNELVHAVFNAPKPPLERVSLSRASLCNTKELLFLVTGAGKQEAVKAWRHGKDLPIAQIRPTNGGTVLIDKAAYGE